MDLHELKELAETGAAFYRAELQERKEELRALALACASDETRFQEFSAAYNEAMAMDGVAEMLEIEAKNARQSLAAERHAILEASRAEERRQAERRYHPTVKAIKAARAISYDPRPTPVNSGRDEADAIARFNQRSPRG